MALEQWLVDGQKTIDIERIRRVKANLIGGSIAVLAHAEPQARVEVTRTSVRNLKVAVDGDTLIIDHPQLAWTDVQESAKTLWKRPEADVSILVPSHVDVDIKAASAEVLIVGLEGDVHVGTAAGEQFIDGTTGELHLQTVDAEISVRDHTGSVTTRTVAGDVTVAGAISSFSGNTVSGATVLDVTAGQPDRIRNRSVTGTATIRIPSSVTPNYRVSTLTADAHLEGEEQQPQRGTPYRSPEASYASGLTEVSLDTIAGRITVVRSPNELEAGSAQAHDAVVPQGFDQRIDERVDAASDTLGVQPDASGHDAGAGLTDAGHAGSPDTEGEVRS